MTSLDGELEWYSTNWPLFRNDQDSMFYYQNLVDVDLPLPAYTGPDSGTPNYPLLEADNFTLCSTDRNQAPDNKLYISSFVYYLLTGLIDTREKNVRDHEHYNCDPENDGFYHCPWEGQNGCKAVERRCDYWYDLFQSLFSPSIMLINLSVLGNTLTPI